MQIFNTVISDSTLDDVQSNCSSLVAAPSYRRKPPPKIDQNMHCTLQQVADALGVSKQRCAMIERSALRKCARWLERHGMLET